MSLACNQDLFWTNTLLDSFDWSGLPYFEYPFSISQLTALISESLPMVEILTFCQNVISTLGIFDSFAMSWFFLSENHFDFISSITESKSPVFKNSSSILQKSCQLIVHSLINFPCVNYLTIITKYDYSINSYTFSKDTISFFYSVRRVL